MVDKFTNSLFPLLPGHQKKFPLTPLLCLSPPSASPPSPVLVICSCSLASVLFWLSVIASNAFLALSIMKAVILSHSCAPAVHARALHVQTLALYCFFFIYFFPHQLEMQQEAYFSQSFFFFFIRSGGKCRTQYSLSTVARRDTFFEIHDLPVDQK